MLKTNKPAKSTEKSQIRKTQKALQTYLVNKATIAYMTLIQKKKPSVTQKIYKSNTLQHRPKRQ